MSKPRPELSAGEQDRLGVLLQALREELNASLAASKKAARPVALDEPIGRLSRVDAMQQQSMAKATRAAVQHRLALVQAALRRHEEGDYGACLSCGEQVGIERLTVKPETPFCIACQGRREGA